MAKQDREKHPSKNLRVRGQGFGVAAGYERSYRQLQHSGKSEKSEEVGKGTESYGPIPHAGYYGAGIGLRPFKIGQAGFSEETPWYKTQYGENTVSGGKRKPDRKK